MEDLERALPETSPGPRGAENAEPIQALRRLRQGRKGELLVALPRGWARAQGVRPGQDLVLHPLEDGRLLVSDPTSPPISDRVELALRPGEPPEHVLRRLVAAYLSGAQEMVLRGDSRSSQGMVSELLRRTTHLEVLAETPTGEVLRDVSGGGSPPLPALLRRMFQQVEELQLTADEALRGSPSPPTQSPARRDDDVDRLAWLIQRAITRTLRLAPGTLPPGTRPPEVVPYLIAARTLERVADHAVRLCESSLAVAQADLPPWLRRSLETLHQQTLSAYRALPGLFFRPEASRANEVIDLAEGIRVARQALLDQVLSHREIDRLPRRALVPLTLTLESIDRTAAYVADLAEAALDWSAELTLASGAAFPPRPRAGGSPAALNRATNNDPRRRNKGERTK